MVEKAEPAGRRRRAASLTAQFLWNMQFEEDPKLINKSAWKPTVSQASLAPVEIPAKRGRKRHSPDLTDKDQTSTVASTASCNDSKKPRNRDSMFPITKPLQVSKTDKGKPKVASVAPLIKSQPTVPKQFVAPRAKSSLPQHVNPIILLPVSLQTNENAGRVSAGEVGSLPLITLQASPDLMNCIGLNKTSPIRPSNQWLAPGFSGSDTRKISLELNTKELTKLSRKEVKVYPQLGDSQGAKAVSTQMEPLNLKMGETTVPSFMKLACRNVKTITAHVQPVKRCRNAQQSATAVNTVKKETELKQETERRKSLSASKSNTAQSKQNRRSNRTSPLTLPGLKAGRPTQGSRRPNNKSPSPDYACSSPDVDDVQRDVRHSCNRTQINLRNKAAPPPGTKEYEVFVEEQRRLLKEANRRHLQKMKRIKMKRAKKVRKDSDEDRSISVPEPSRPLTPEEQKKINNRWEWSGDPYTSYAYSLKMGKYIRRQCYPAMKRSGDDGDNVVMVRDCILLLTDEGEGRPFIGKVAALWENPQSKEMKMSLIWYYRPEHVEKKDKDKDLDTDKDKDDDETKNNENPKSKTLCNGTNKKSAKEEEPVAENELFLSRHQDEMSVACIEGRCHVLTYGQYRRAYAGSRRDGMWARNDGRKIVPRLPRPKNIPRMRRRIPGEISTELDDLYICRRFYDASGRRMLKNIPNPVSLVTNTQDLSS